MEVEEINQTYFASIHGELSLIEEHAWWADQVLAQLRLYIMDLRFLERFSVWIAAWEYGDATTSKRFGCVWREEGKELASLLSQVRGGYITDWNVLASHLKQKIQDSKPLIEEWSKGLLSSSFTSEPPRTDEILHILLDAIVNNLMDLVSYKACKNVPLIDQIETLEEKLVFLQNFLKLNTKCIYNKDFKELENRIHSFANNATCQFFLYWVNGTAEAELMLSDMLFRIKPCMPDVMASYFPTLKYDASTGDDIVRYIDAILSSLKHLVSYKASMIGPFNKQIVTLEQSLVFLQNFLILAANCINPAEFQEFVSSVHDFSENAASLTVHYWLNQGDERIAFEMNRMLSDMVQKFEPCTPHVTALYFGMIKAMKLQPSDTHLLGQTIVSFVDLLIKNLATATLKADLQILREELIFVLTFLADPPMENAIDDKLTSVLQHIDVLLLDWRRIFFPYMSMRDVSIEIRVLKFQQEIETINDRIRRLYCKFPYSSMYDYPKISGQGFLDFLIRYLRNLKEKLISDTECVPFAKKTIWKIEEELVSLRSLINDILDMQINQNELSETWLKLYNLAYLTEHAVNSCFVLDFPIWYHMAHLSDVLNRIKVIKTEFKKIKECSLYNVGVLPGSSSSTSILSTQVGTSDINQVVVGFEEEASTIIDKLIGGHKSLDIVSIVGMPGLGKTTLARKVYGEPSVKTYFHIFAFCFASRDKNAKRLLHDILSNIGVMGDVYGMTEHELAHQLQKCLRGRRYLIVMDNMCEISVWNEVKSSFPDDQNGSRVMLTTRFHNLATQAQINCSPYPLGFLSDEKCWQLLQMKAIPDGSCSLEFSDVGKLIAKNCKGLPLSVVVIGGLLAKSQPSLSWWNHIAERIGSYLSYEEGCMDMLRLTYKLLPEYLKPLLLYFGAFPEGTLVSVKSLMLLWIGEGFVHESKTKSLVDVAKDYLRDLVDRSLIIVTGRSSNDGIKTVGIHDLIHGFCRIKARAEKIFRVLPCASTSKPIEEQVASIGKCKEEHVASTSIRGRGSLDITTFVGRAGLGKTILARKVYDDSSVNKSQFHIFACCSISRDHDVDLIDRILSISMSMTIDDLMHRLWKCLMGRKYLIVMDDVWEIRAWNDVERSFLDDEDGSRLVFTARFNKVDMEAQIECRPPQLDFFSSHDESWELLQRKEFTGGSCYPEFYGVRKLIAKNCKGLPLAAVVIAGLLARIEPGLSRWSEIAEQIGSCIFEEQGYIDMLELTYKHLPESLKPLFLSFEAYPEGMLISVKRLMLLWIDEGFVRESETKSLEDVAKDYLHDLVDRNLITVYGRSSNGGIESVSVHELIHDFCRMKAQGENFYQQIKARAKNFHQLRRGNALSSFLHHPIYDYRVCLHMAGEATSNVTPIFPFVRSLVSFQRHHFDTSSIIGKLVQVLHLDDMWLDGQDLEQICLLFHLRHLVAIVDHLVSVPSCISNLWAMETFILRTLSKGEIILPESIWKMKRLRHVNIGRCRLTFPSGQHEQLNNLESFSSPTLSTGKQLEDLLQRLPAVRKLSCSFDKSRDYDDKRDEALDFLGQLETLNLSYVGYRSPYVIKFPSTLKKLKLVGVMLPWTAISDIGKLEHLEVLKLLWNSFVGPRCDMEDVVFPSLKFLKLNGLNLVHWNAVPDSFPCLEQLFVIGCEDLVEIPACFGVVSTLKKFEVHVCRKATESAVLIKKDQMDFGNDTLEVDISYGYI